MSDDLTIAFAMRIDEQGLDYEAGVQAAEDLAAELVQVAEERHAPARPPKGDQHA